MSQSGSVNAGPSPTFWETDGAEPPDERGGLLEPGETLGRYVVLYRLGTGGMGIVYAAYDPQLDRKVALKLLRRPSSNPARRKRATERLLREARAMARLTHPNVITVHDVAVLDGRIFVAMEYVDGVTLTRHLAGGEHGWRKTLATLLEAGRGLAAAHEGGLVHRDFKPDNVMLGRDGRVLVMDFGLARALEPDDPESIHGTARPPTAAQSDLHDDGSGVRPISSSIGKAPASRVAGTPGYMAPEQHRAMPTDSRTDQFSFCVTVYEALYRQRPYKGDTPDEIADEIEAERVVDAPPNHGVPNWLRSVVLRGLRSRPEDRYDSMGELLAALKKDPAIQRRRWLLRGGVAGLIGATAVATALLGTDREEGVCEGAQERMAGVWDDGRKGTVASVFLAVDRPYAGDALERTIEGMDRYAAEWTAMHRETCEANRVHGEQSDDLMDLRMECLGRRHSELRALSDLFVEADVDVVKESVVATSKLTPLAACADALLLKTTVPMPEDPMIRKDVNRIREELARAKAYEDAGRYERALEMVDTVLDDARATGYDPVLSEALSRRGRTLLEMGNLRDAEIVLRESLRSAALGRHDEFAAIGWIALGGVLSQGGQIERAQEATSVAEFAMLRAGPTPELRAQLANVQGLVAFSKGDYAQAQIAFERALAQQQEAFGETHPSVARFLNNLAVSHGQLGDMAESFRFLTRAVELEERVLGSVHPRVALFVGNLGAMEIERGNLQEAERLTLRAIDILDRSSKDNPKVGMFINNLGNISVLNAELDLARERFARAAELQERVLGEHPDLGLSLANLAAVYVLLEQPEAAMASIDRAAGILRPEHPAYAHVLAARAEAELLLGRPESAADHYGQAIAQVTAAPGLSLGADTGVMRFGLARAMVAAGRDKTKARALAVQGREELGLRPAAPARSQWIQRIDTWLAENYPEAP